MLTDRPFLDGDKFGVGDVAVGSWLNYAIKFKSFDFGPWPAVDAYLKKLSQRPAFLSTVGAK